MQLHNTVESSSVKMFKLSHLVDIWDKVYEVEQCWYMYDRFFEKCALRLEYVNFAQW